MNPNRNPSFHQNCFVLLIVFCCCCNVLFAQKEQPVCANVHSGTFYIYPENTAEKYVDIRDNEYVHETDITTGDTSLWKIKWLNDCTYSLSLVEVSGDKAAMVRAIMNKHTLVYKIKSVTSEYYVFDGYLDKTSNLPIQTDTMWMTDKVVANNELFKPVPDSVLLKAQRISDTSKYALLYVYRPGKLALSLSDFLVYFDNNLMCVMHNNSGFVFRILKEGTFELKSRLYKAEQAIPINVQFGNMYYVKATMDWGMHKHLYNFKMDNQLVSPAAGMADFGDLKFRK